MRTIHQVSNSNTPRDIPIGLKLKTMFGGVTAIIGIAFFVMGMLFLGIFGSLADWSSLKFSDNDPVTTGWITNVKATNSTMNEQTVYAYSYEFKLFDGTNYEGKSYYPGYVLHEGDAVDIQFIKNEPNTSRIVEMKGAVFPLWVLLIILPFVLIGAVFLFFNIRKGIKANHLLRYGKIGYGTLIDKSPTNMTINDRPVYRLTFEFKAEDGRTYQVDARSHTPEVLEDEPQEKLVYDITNPAQAVVIDELPRSIKLYFQNIDK